MKVSKFFIGGVIFISTVIVLLMAVSGGTHAHKHHHISRPQYQYVGKGWTFGPWFKARYVLLLNRNKVVTNQVPVERCRTASSSNIVSWKEHYVHIDHAKKYVRHWHKVTKFWDYNCQSKKWKHLSTSNLIALGEGYDYLYCDNAVNYDYSSECDGNFEYNIAPGQVYPGPHQPNQPVRAEVLK